MFNEEVRQELKMFLLNKIRSKLSENMCYMEYYSRSSDYSEEDFSDLCYTCGADRYDSGVTKVTLFYHDLQDWVIKVPILGCYYEAEYDYCDYEESGAEKANDYCLAEMDYCKEAVAAGIADCFAKTYYICNIDGIDFYCSEKVDLIYHDRYSYWSKINYTNPNSVEQAKSLMSMHDSYLDTAELALFIDAYGESMAEDLVRFLFDFGISDLHHGNLGFDANDYIKIIDCAGWRD